MITGDYSRTSNFDVLGELRDDFSSHKIYPNPGFEGEEAYVWKKSQGEVLLKAIWKFGTPVPTT